MGFAGRQFKRVQKLGGAELSDFSVEKERHWQRQVRMDRFLYAAVLDEMCAETGIKLRYTRCQGKY